MTRMMPAAIHSKGRLLGLFLVPVLLSGCDKQPGGQVVAVVGNEEITRKELVAESGAASAAAGPEADTANAAALQRLVDRTVLANYARSEGLDRSVEYVERRRQFDQTLLAALAIRKLVGQTARPGAAQIKTFIDDRPLWFSRRQKMKLDQVRISTPTDRRIVEEAVRLKSLDDVSRYLDGKGIAYVRGTVVLDTSSIPHQIAAQIADLDLGEIFDINEGQYTYVSVITDRVQRKSDPTTWQAIAAELMARDQAGQKLDGILGKLRENARVRYDAAYQPKAKGQPASVDP